MEIANLIPHIEALVFASERPLTSLEITELLNNAFGYMEDKIVLDQVESSLEGILEKYQSEFYPFEVRQSGGGWQFLTKKEFHKTVAQLNGEKFLKRLSAAALETLAIIAYKQPITKGEIEAIRGVNSDYSVQKLLEKELIIITGRNEKLPGHPLVYSVSKNFMDYFGINSTDDLPKIKEVLAEQLVAATYMNSDNPDAGQADEAVSPETNAASTAEDQVTDPVTETADAEPLPEPEADAPLTDEPEPTGESEAALEAVENIIPASEPGELSSATGEADAEAGNEAPKDEA